MLAIFGREKLCSDLILKKGMDLFIIPIRSFKSGYLTRPIYMKELKFTTISSRKKTMGTGYRTGMVGYRRVPYRSIFVGHFCPSGSRYGSSRPKSMRIQIRNTGIKWYVHHYRCTTTRTYLRMTTLEVRLPSLRCEQFSS